MVLVVWDCRVGLKVGLGGVFFRGIGLFVESFWRIVVICLMFFLSLSIWLIMYRIIFGEFRCVSCMVVCKLLWWLFWLVISVLVRFFSNSILVCFMGCCFVILW